MLKSIRNSLVITSVLYVVLGVLLLIFPSTALQLASMLIGAVTLIYAAVRIISYLRADPTTTRRFELFIGVLLAALGIFLLICPKFISSLIPVALGIYIIVDSVSAIKKALDMKALSFEKWWISLLVAALLAVFGVVMILNPFGMASSLVIFIGVTFIFDGVFTLTNTVVSSHVFHQ